jgi:hypothetical protein
MCMQISVYVKITGVRLCHKNITEVRLLYFFLMLFDFVVLIVLAVYRRLSIKMIVNEEYIRK